MKHLTLFLLGFIVFSVILVTASNAATDSCATVGQSTGEQYINSTITLKILLVEFSDVLVK